MSWYKRLMFFSTVLSRSISLFCIASLLHEVEDLALLYDRRLSLLGGEIVAFKGSICGLYGVFAICVFQYTAFSSHLSLFTFFSAFFFPFSFSYIFLSFLLFSPI